MCVPSFNLLLLTVPEESVTKIFNVWKLERKKKWRNKGMNNSSSLIQVYTIHPPIVHVCTKFQPQGLNSSWEKCDEKFSFERLQNYGITEGQGKSSIAPTFSKRGYNEFFSKLRLKYFSSFNIQSIISTNQMHFVAIHLCFYCNTNILQIWVALVIWLSWQHSHNFSTKFLQN